MKKIVLFLIVLASFQCLFAQRTLTGTSYSESFDGIGLGLPTGWSSRTGAGTTSRGSSATYVPTTTPWSTTTGSFYNYASAEGLTSTSSNSAQNSSTDRAFGVRPSGSFGDPGEAFELQLANTTGRRDFSLSLKHQTLSQQGRTSTYTVQYSTIAAGNTGAFQIVAIPPKKLYLWKKNS